MYTNHNYDHDFYDDFERHNTIYHRSLSYLTSVNGGDTINDNYNDNDGGADGSSDDESSLSLVSPTGLVVGFSLIAAAFLITAVCIVRCNWHCKEFYEWNGIRIIMPGMCVLLAIKNAAMAYDYERPKASSHLSILVYMISSTIAPGIFIFTFVMTFLAYRTRSLPFCFVHRGPGRSGTGESRLDEDDELYQPLVRPAILVVCTRMFALSLLVLSIVVNFNVISHDYTVGLTGWATLVNLVRNKAFLEDPDGTIAMAIFLSLLPMALVSLLCLYFACLIWRYGCEFSMIINTSFFNSWVSPVFGALAMIIGQMFGPDLFLITSNTGILLYMVSMTRVLYEIRHDIRQAGDLGDFLNALENARSGKKTENDDGDSDDDDDDYYDDDNEFYGIHNNGGGGGGDDDNKFAHRPRGNAGNILGGSRDDSSPRNNLMGSTEEFTIPSTDPNNSTQGTLQSSTSTREQQPESFRTLDSSQQQQFDEELGTTPTGPSASSTSGATVARR